MDPNPFVLPAKAHQEHLFIFLKKTGKINPNKLETDIATHNAIPTQEAILTQSKKTNVSGFDENTP